VLEPETSQMVQRFDRTVARMHHAANRFSIVAKHNAKHVLNADIFIIDPRVLALDSRRRRLWCLVLADKPIDGFRFASPFVPDLRDAVVCPVSYRRSKQRAQHTPLTHFLAPTRDAASRAMSAFDHQGFSRECWQEPLKCTPTFHLEREHGRRNFGQELATIMPESDE